MNEIVAYARVSTRDQSLEAQIAELNAAGAVRVFSDHGVSSRVENRPGWTTVLAGHGGAGAVARGVIQLILG